MLTFEDFRPGPFTTLGPRRVSRDEIVAFAAEFDPQPFHLDEAAAARSMLAGLAGSGWHMCALAMRMMVDGFLGQADSRTGLGVDELRWLSPLRPDDEITLEVQVQSTRLSKSRPDAGIVTLHLDMFNAARSKLLMMTTSVMIGRRQRTA